MGVSFNENQTKDTYKKNKIRVKQESRIKYQELNQESRIKNQNLNQESKIKNQELNQNSKIKNQELNQESKIKNRELNQKSAPSVELTIRMPSNTKFVERLYCWILRSAVVFWDVKKYGRIVLILDGDDESKESNDKLIRALDNAKHPLLNFRYVYEAPPKDKRTFELKTKELKLRRYGYHLQLYSMFLMDLYTNNSIIAYSDTDAPFILPVGNSAIFSKEGKLKVIGIKPKEKIWAHVIPWKKATQDLLGLPMVFDFMVYFPVYLYPSTLKNCRDFIIQRMKVDTFEKAFLKGSNHFVSSVNVILHYAFFHERDRYDWHLDISEEETLATFNKKYLENQNASLLPQDIQVEPHSTVHAKYFRPQDKPPLEVALCFLKIKLGRDPGKNCTQYLGKKNLEPLQFEPKVTHYKTWCNGIDGMKKCEEVVNQRYNEIIVNNTAKKDDFYDEHIRKVEESLWLNYKMQCPVLNI